MDDAAARRRAADVRSERVDHVGWSPWRAYEVVQVVQEREFNRMLLSMEYHGQVLDGPVVRDELEDEQ